MSRRFLPRRVSDSGVGFPTGTVLAGFQQTSAPPGWTKNTTHDDKALRVVTGTPTTGGSVAFSTVFGLTATDGYTLIDPTDIPSHAHTGGAHSHGVTAMRLVQSNAAGTQPTATVQAGGASAGNSDTGIVSGSIDSGGAVATSARGSDGAHAHAIDLQVNHVDVIICTKN